MLELLSVGPKFTRLSRHAAAQLSINISCPRPTSAANPPAAAAAVDRRDRQTDTRPFCDAMRTTRSSYRLTAGKYHRLADANRQRVVGLLTHTFQEGKVERRWRTGQIVQMVAQSANHASSALVWYAFHSPCTSGGPYRDATRRCTGP